MTGGGNGLGRATAELLLKNGARTIIADLPHPKTPKEISSKILSASSVDEGTIVFLPTDVWIISLLANYFGTHS